MLTRYCRSVQSFESDKDKDQVSQTLKCKFIRKYKTLLIEFWFYQVFAR